MESRQQNLIQQLYIFMHKNSKSIPRIFALSNSKDKSGVQNNSISRSPRTPKRKPIFSQEKYTTQKKKRYQGKIIANHKSNQKQSKRQDFKNEAAEFLKKILSRIQIKNNLVKTLQAQNELLKKQNQHLNKQNDEILKRIAVCSGFEKLKDKNTEYRAKLLKAEALLYQLRRASKLPMKGIDQLINSLHI